MKTRNRRSTSESDELSVTRQNSADNNIRGRLLRDDAKLAVVLGEEGCATTEQEIYEWKHDAHSSLTFTRVAKRRLFAAYLRDFAAYFLSLTLTVAEPSQGGQSESPMAGLGHLRQPNDQTKVIWSRAPERVLYFDQFNWFGGCISWFYPCFDGF
jgi:hypothetical protein